MNLNPKAVKKSNERFAKIKLKPVRLVLVVLEIPMTPTYQTLMMMVELKLMMENAGLSIPARK